MEEHSEGPIALALHGYIFLRQKMRLRGRTCILAESRHRRYLTFLSECKMTEASLDPGQTAPKRAVLPIFVLYNYTLKDSATYQTFVASSHYGILDQTLIAVYDNSQIPQARSAEEEPFAMLRATKFMPCLK